MADSIQTPERRAAALLLGGDLAVAAVRDTLGVPLTGPMTPAAAAARAAAAHKAAAAEAKAAAAFRRRLLPPDSDPAAQQAVWDLCSELGADIGALINDASILAAESAARKRRLLAVEADAEEASARAERLTALLRRVAPDSVSAAIAAEEAERAAAQAARVEADRVRVRRLSEAANTRQARIRALPAAAKQTARPAPSTWSQILGARKGAEVVVARFAPGAEKGAPPERALWLRPVNGAAARWLVLGGLAGPESEVVAGVEVGIAGIVRVLGVDAVFGRCRMLGVTPDQIRAALGAAGIPNPRRAAVAQAAPRPTSGDNLAIVEGGAMAAALTAAGVVPAA